MKKIVLACDLGGTNLRVAAVDEVGGVLARSRQSTPRTASGVALMGDISAAADKCLAELGAGHELVGVAAAVPATVDFERGAMRNAPNLPYLDGFAIRDALAEAFGVEVVLENDANAAAVAENWLGAAKGVSNSVMLTLGTGVGGGLIINGSLFRGIDGTAGEIGHVCIEPAGPKCGCGSNGCLEQYASATGIVRIAEELAAEFPGSELNKGASALEVFDAGVRGDALALATFAEMGRYLGIAIADLLNILNPEVVVIGGGAAGAWDLFIGHVRNQINEKAFPEPAQRAQIRRASLGDDAGTLGAARLVFEALKTNGK